jgi:eukaryotic-like serine/threonine-protein kinase
LRERLSERDRLYVEGHYYGNANDFEKSFPIWFEWIRTYPNDYEPYVLLGSDYANVGQYEKGATAVREALRLEPEHSGAAAELMMHYLAMNRLDEAMSALQNVRASNLDGKWAHFLGYLLAFVESDPAAMQERLRGGMSVPGAQGIMLSTQSDTEAYRGSFHRARESSQAAVKSEIRAGREELAARWRAQQALREAEIGNFSGARKGAMEALALSAGREVGIAAALALARAGDVEAARRMADSLRQEYPVDTMLLYFWLPTIQSAIELNRGDPQKAIATLAWTRTYELGMPYGFDNLGNLYPVYVLGLAQLKAGQAQESAAEFQKMIDHPGIVLNWVTGALAHLQLGRAQAMMGDKAAARKSYQDFLALWKDADPDIPIYQQAKSEYAKLR